MSSAFIGSTMQCAATRQKQWPVNPAILRGPGHRNIAWGSVRKPGCRGLSAIQARRDTEEAIKSNHVPKAGSNGSEDTTRFAQVFAETIASPVFYLVAGVGAIGALSLTGETVALTVVLSALPVVGLTLLSKSNVGVEVQRKLEEHLPELEADAEATRQAWREAAQRSPFFGSDRPVLPWGSARHLTGELPGDYGFDPLGLAVEVDALEKYTEYELLHGRWAMLGAVGCLIPEALDLNGIDVGEPIWWKVGAAKLSGDITINYAGIEGFRIAGKQGLAVIALCQIVLMGGPEYARYVGIKSLEPVGVFLPGEKNYPGGQPFDPLEYSKDADGFVEQTVKEVKNARLAMLAMLGYAAQALVTGAGPLQNLLDFLADPVHNNVFGVLATK
eukprot:CAMPEP_0117671690 /NCGR_PEP_ID=MMETSP0804-20121206/13481_1 /TAXON_ID=1074897 /ORGANISM="Tetraselmis astigmatica, Strain CCMP880" /LENGTH=387 /DNA_ID=CAMNT_0005480193 /DNA_START=40 /DNA_END=1203 /DNA_ORIENTATION=-